LLNHPILQELHWWGTSRLQSIRIPNPHKEQNQTIRDYSRAISLRGNSTQMNLHLRNQKSMAQMLLLWNEIFIYFTDLGVFLTQFLINCSLLTESIFDPNAIGAKKKNCYLQQQSITHNNSNNSILLITITQEEIPDYGVISVNSGGQKNRLLKSDKVKEFEVNFQ